MASATAVLLLFGLVTIIALGAVAVLSPASSGQTVTEIPSQAADNLKDIASDIVQEPQDSDSDGMPDEQEVEMGTDPANPDTDGDGLTDREETEMSTSPKDKDIDRDGLEDSKEREYGTNPRDRDTDGDGLDDGDEVKHGTSPTNPNTDGDRYRDNEDADPLSKNSAVVKITVSDLELQENYNALDSGTLDHESALATVTVDMIIRNDGNDYASFVKFDGVFLMDGIELKRVTKDTGKVGAGKWLDKHITFTLDISDIPVGALSEISRSIEENILPVISFEIRNVKYEKF